jgi:hypothetical protein
MIWVLYSTKLENINKNQYLEREVWVVFSNSENFYVEKMVEF